MLKKLSAQGYQAIPAEDVMISVLGVCLSYTFRMRNPERHNVASEAA
jgi:hypothetical protein